MKDLFSRRLLLAEKESILGDYYSSEIFTSSPGLGVMRVVATELLRWGYNMGVIRKWRCLA